MMTQTPLFPHPCKPISQMHSHMRMEINLRMITKMKVQVRYPIPQIMNSLNQWSRLAMKKIGKEIKLKVSKKNRQISKEKVVVIPVIKIPKEKASINTMPMKY